LDTTKLRLRKVKKEGVAVIKFGLNERGCDSASNVKVESVPYRYHQTLNKHGHTYIQSRDYYYVPSLSEVRLFYQLGHAEES